MTRCDIQIFQTMEEITEQVYTMIVKLESPGWEEQNSKASAEQPHARAYLFNCTTDPPQSESLQPRPALPFSE